MMSSCTRKKLFAYLGIWLLVACFFLLDIHFGENTSATGGVFSIHFDCYGLDADELEILITIPFEEELTSLGDFREIRSVTELGKSIVTVYLHETTKNKDVYKKIHKKMHEFYETLPPRVQRPKLYQSDSKQSPIFSAFFWSNTYSLSDISLWLERTIVPQLENIEGVAEITISGKASEEICIEFDTKKAAFGSVNPDLFSLMIQDNSIKNGRTLIKDGKFIQPVDVEKTFSSLQSIKNLPLKNASRILLPFDSLAEISKKTKEVEKIVRLNGKEGLGFSIKICDGANIFQICDTAESLIQTKKDVENIILYNQGKEHKKLLKDISFSVLESALLAIMVLPFLFGLSKNLVVAILSIPFSVFGTFSTLSFLNVAIDVYVLAGFSIGLGLLLDNALVLLEIAEKSLTKELFFQTLSTMIPSFISATITTIFCFIPLYFLDFLFFGMRIFSVTIVILLGYSLVFSLFVMPHCMEIGKKRIRSSQKVVSCFFYLLLDRGRNFLKKNYCFSKIIFLLLSLFSLVILIFIPKSIKESTDKEYVLFYCDYDPEIAKDVLAEESNFFVQEILKIPHVKYVSTDIQKGNVEGCIYFDEKKLSKKKLYKLLSGVSKKLTRGFLYFPEDNFLQKEFTLELCIAGNSQKESQGVAKNFARYCADFEEVKNVVLHFKREEENISFLVDTLSLNRQGLTPYSLANTLHWTMQGPVVDSVFFDKEYDIRIKGKNTEKSFLDEIKNLYIPTKKEGVSLDSLGKFEKTYFINRHNRKNLQHCSFISLAVSASSGFQAKKIVENLCKNYSFPQGFVYNFSFEVESGVKNYYLLFAVVICCGILLLLLLIALHENLKNALCMISLILPSLFLPLVIKLVGKRVLLLGDVIGIICVCGLVINNGIFLFEGYKKTVSESLKDKWVSLLSANVTTILGAIPLCFKDSLGFVSHISFFVLFGTLASFVVSVCIAPILFKKR